MRMIVSDREVVAWKQTMRWKRGNIHHLNCYGSIIRWIKAGKTQVDGVVRPRNSPIWNSVIFQFHQKWSRTEWQCDTEWGSIRVRTKSCFLIETFTEGHWGDSVALITLTRLNQLNETRIITQCHVIWRWRPNQTLCQYSELNSKHSQQIDAI